MSDQTRKLFRALRRMYRLTRRGTFVLAVGIEANSAAVSALRTFTGRWDLCEPPYRGSWGTLVSTPGGQLIHRPHVAAACTRWIRRVGR